MPTALIAEDEPLLAQTLQSELAFLWPQLHIVACVGDGASAVAQALHLRPDVLFFDIRMPGRDGLEAAHDLLDQWPAQHRFPALVFVTAYEQYALAAFEAQAADYVLKPVQRPRLAQTVQRLQARLQTPLAPEAALAKGLQLLRQLAAPHNPQTVPLQALQASVGNTVHRVPLAEVLFLQAADKYVRAVCATREYLLRTPLKELLSQLDPDTFWQIHRSTVVRADCIARMERNELGHMQVRLQGHPEVLPLSRVYAFRFKTH